MVRFNLVFDRHLHVESQRPHFIVWIPDPMFRADVMRQVRSVLAHTHNFSPNEERAVRMIAFNELGVLKSICATRESGLAKAGRGSGALQTRLRLHSVHEAASPQPAFAAASAPGPI